MKMKGLLTCGTPLILPHKPDNTIQYCLKHLITIDKMDQEKGSSSPVRLKRVYVECNRSQETGVKGKSQVLSFPHAICYLKMQNLLFYDLHK